jgi:TRAP-type mannitol/chloroaromatic compound transport system permease large subunit
VLYCPRIAPEVPLPEIFKGSVPFLLALLICTALLMAFPQIALFPAQPDYGHRQTKGILLLRIHY